MEFLYRAAPSIKINCITLTQDLDPGFSMGDVFVAYLNKEFLAVT